MKKLFLILAVCSVFVSANAFAASPIRLIGLEAGYVSPDVDGLDSVDGTWVAGAFLDFGLPATNLYVSPFINYWSSSTEIPGGPTNDELNLRDFSLGANLKFTIPTASVRFQPFIAAGVSVNMMNAEQTGFESNSETKFGFQGGAGFKIGLNESMSALGSGWYNVISNDTGDVKNWSLRAGVGFNM